MKQYKVTITNGDYPLSYACDTIADAYECLRTLKFRMPGIVLEPEELMECLVRMRNGELLKSEWVSHSVAVLDEED